MKLTKLIRALSLPAAALFAASATAQTSAPSEEQRTCLMAKFERAQDAMAAASTEAAELFKTHYPDKAGLLTAMQEAEAVMRDGSRIVFRNLIATDPAKLNLREGMGIDSAVPFFSIDTELKTLVSTDGEAQALLARGEAVQKTLESDEASMTWYREEAMPALQAEVIAIQQNAQTKLAEINQQDCGWPATGAAALSDTRRACMIEAVKAQSAARIAAEQATAALWSKAVPEHAALIAAERDRTIADAEIAAIEFAQAASTAPSRLLLMPDAEELSQFAVLSPIEMESVRIELYAKDAAYTEAKERRRAATRDSFKLGGLVRLTYLKGEAQASGVALDDQLFKAEQAALDKASEAGAAKCPR